MVQFFLNRTENIVGKGEMLVTSIFSFSHKVFKRLLPQGRKKPGLLDKGSREIITKIRGNIHNHQILQIMLFQSSNFH